MNNDDFEDGGGLQGLDFDINRDGGGGLDLDLGDDINRSTPGRLSLHNTPSHPGHLMKELSLSLSISGRPLSSNPHGSRSRRETDGNIELSGKHGGTSEMSDEDFL